MELPSGTTLNLDRHQIGMSDFLRRNSQKMEYARDNPVRSIEKPSDKDAVREHILTDAEERLYFGRTKGNLHDVARLILLQGLRPEEAMSLTKAAVSLEAGKIKILRGKSKAARRVLKLTLEAANIIGQRMESPGPWVFGSPKNPERHITKLNCPHDRVMLRTGLSFVLYDLRHTFATRMIEAGVDVVALKDILGHTDIRTTMRYVHLSQAHKDQAMDLYQKTLDGRRSQVIN